MCSTFLFLFSDVTRKCRVEASRWGIFAFFLTVTRLTRSHGACLRLQAAMHYKPVRSTATAVEKYLQVSSLCHAEKKERNTILAAHCLLLSATVRDEAGSVLLVNDGTSHVKLPQCTTYRVGVLTFSFCFFPKLRAFLGGWRGGLTDTSNGGQGGCRHQPHRAKKNTFLVDFWEFDIMHRAEAQVEETEPIISLSVPHFPTCVPPLRILYNFLGAPTAV